MGAEDFFAAEDFIVECTTSVVAKFNAPVSILAITVSLLCPVSLAIVSRIVFNLYLNATNLVEVERER